MHETAVQNSESSSPPNERKALIFEILSDQVYPIKLNIIEITTRRNLQMTNRQVRIIRIPFERTRRIYILYV